MNNSIEKEVNSERKIFDIAIKLSLILLLVVWCIKIILPFTELILWGGILAITLYPLNNKLSKVFKGKSGWSSFVLICLLVLILIVPAIWIIGAIASETKNLITSFNNGTLVIPPPNSEIAEWPVIGKPLYQAWNMLATNTDQAIATYRDTIMQLSQKLLNSIMSITSNFFMFIFSLIIAGIFLVRSQKTEKNALNFFTHLMGNQGEEYLTMVVQTVRNVAKGILGVAFIQFLLFGFTFLIAGVPFAGLIALFAFFLAIIQLPTGIIGIPIIIYLYSVESPLLATVYAIIIIVISLSDNILKPWLMGKNAPVPFLVIFLGALGGFIFTGFMGLFTGAIILSIGYKLVNMWIKPSIDKQLTDDK